MNVLLCLDHSSASRKAVDFAGRILGKANLPKLSITLFHIAELLPEYVLSDQLSPGMTPRALAESWAAQAKSAGQALLEETKQTLQSAGVPASALQFKLTTMSCLPESKKVAAALSLIDEIKSGNYDVVCIGRRGASEMASSFLGGVAEKVIRECHGKTVWLVD